MTNTQISKKISGLEKSFEKGLESINKGLEAINEIKKYVTSSEKEKTKSVSKVESKMYDSKSLMARVTSIVSACEEVGEKHKNVLARAGKSIDSVAYEEIKVFIQALRKGQGKDGTDWVPDFSKGNTQEKWVPVFDLSGGFVFVSSNYEYFYTYTYTVSGVFLCLPTKELSNFAARTISQKYKEFYTGKK
jgi:hypothetical protein